MGLSTALIKKLDEFDTKTRDLFLDFMDEVEEKTRTITVGRADFTELTETVQRLAEAQKQTEQRIGELTASQNRLAEAQERTEQRIGELTVSQNRLSEAQERTDQRIGKLTEAQERTDQRIEKLTEAQERTEQQIKELMLSQNQTGQQIQELTAMQKRFAESEDRLKQSMDGLAEAQRQTEKTLKKYIVDHEIVKKQMGGLTMSVGYGIEDRLIPKMKAAALHEFGIDVSLVDRRNVVYPDGKYDEINIYCEGNRSGKPVFIIGEAKALPGKKDFDRFSQLLDRLKQHLKGDIEAFMVGYQYAPDVESYANRKYPHIRRYKTFQLLMFSE